MTGPTLDKMSPFFIVSSVAQTIAFYRDKLGFETWHQQPEGEPFFAIVGRDGAMLLVKSGEVKPAPNARREPAMRWDAFVTVNDPDALAAEFVGRGATFSAALQDTPDGLRGFEVTDPDGYVLFFGRPAQRPTELA